jgi:5-methyltetrahydropteroyltriglutamate--homocysteine methyltransferase
MLPTALVGSYALPGWFLVAMEGVRQGRFGRLDLNELIDDTVALVVREQEDAGIDIVSDGEVQRQDFIMGFYDRLVGLRPVEPSRKLGPPLYDTVTRYETTDRISAPRGLGTRDEYEKARALTKRPVKVAVPGPLTLMNAIKLAPPYTDHETMAEDLARIINAELRLLVEAGCRVVQIDEPSAPYHFASPPRAVALVNRALEGIGGGAITTALHICFGNLRGRPQDRRTYREWMPAFAGCRADMVMLEFANREMAEIEMWKEYGTGKILGAGLVDVKSFYIEKPAEIAARIRTALKAAAPDKLWITPDCGFFSTPRWIAKAKMNAMTRAVQMVRHELASA